MNRIRSVLELLIPILGGLAVSLYLLGLEKGLLCWAVCALVFLRLKKDQRYRQWLLPIFAVVWSLVMLGLSVWLKIKYQQALANVPGWLEDLLGPFSPDVAPILLIWNGIFLGVFVLVKVSALIWLQITESPPKPVASAGWSSAYLYRPIMGWVLKPWWRYARWLSWCIATGGLVALVYVWLSLDGVISSNWLPMLTGAIFLVGLELASWLGGDMDEVWQPEFEGSDSTTILMGQFAQLWERYRKKWHTKWLAAGNLVPQRAEDERGKG